MENQNLQVNKSELTQIKPERISRLLTQNSQEIVVADLIGDELSPVHGKAATAILQIAYGQESPQEKLDLLYSMCREEGWSGKRFLDTLRWVVKNKPWPDWKISDFFTAPLLKLRNRTWYYEQCHNKIACKTYEVNGTMFYALATDEIPLPEYVPKVRYEVDAPEAPQTPPEEHSKVLSNLGGVLKQASEEIIPL